MGIQKKFTIAIYISLQILITFNVLFVLKVTEVRAAVPIIIMAICSILSYLATVLTNPGESKLYSNQQLNQLRTSEYSNKFQSIQSISKTNKQSSHCQACQIDIKLRQKHCKICNTCILTFDHHCTVMNSCIGEFNRPYFLLFLISLSTQTTSFAIQLLGKQFTRGVQNSDLMNLSFLIILWPIMVMLLGFHTYLMFSNQTTYEVLKKEEILYISNAQKKAITQKDDKSPANRRKGVKIFDQGLFKNIILYFLPVCKKEPIDWTMYYCPN